MTIIIPMIIEYQINNELYETIILDTDKCEDCGLCTTICSQGVISWDDINKMMVVEHPELCDSCNLCACPFGATTYVPYNAESINPFIFIQD